jgi:hypothetical protein
MAIPSVLPRVILNNSYRSILTVVPSYIYLSVFRNMSLLAIFVDDYSVFNLIMHQDFGDIIAERYVQNQLLPK